MGDRGICFVNFGKIDKLMINAQHMLKHALFMEYDMSFLVPGCVCFKSGIQS